MEFEKKKLNKTTFSTICYLFVTVHEYIHIIYIIPELATFGNIQLGTQAVEKFVRIISIKLDDL